MLKAFGDGWTFGAACRLGLPNGGKLTLKNALTVKATYLSINSAGLTPSSLAHGQADLGRLLDQASHGHLGRIAYRSPKGPGLSANRCCAVLWDLRWQPLGPHLLVPWSGLIRSLLLGRLFIVRLSEESAKPLGVLWMFLLRSEAAAVTRLRQLFGWRC